MQQLQRHAYSCTEPDFALVYSSIYQLIFSSHVSKFLYFIQQKIRKHEYFNVSLNYDMIIAILWQHFRALSIFLFPEESQLHLWAISPAFFILFMRITFISLRKRKPAASLGHFSCFFHPLHAHNIYFSPQRKASCIFGPFLQLFSSSSCA